MAVSFITCAPVDDAATLQRQLLSEKAIAIATIPNFKIAVGNPQAVIPADIDPLDNFMPHLGLISSTVAAKTSKKAKARFQHEICHKLNAASSLLYSGRINIEGNCYIRQFAEEEA